MTGTYEIIYADPPWRYSAKKVQGAAENHYPTMSIDELCALPVAELAAKDSALFMWATFPQLPEALRLIRAWGFTYKSVAFVWLKKNKKADSWFYGLGFWTRANAEVCLLATKGHPKRQAADIHQFIISPIEAHSKKPDETRDKIVALMGDRPRVELFARQTPPGWDVWGNEVEPTAGLWSRWPEDSGKEDVTCPTQRPVDIGTFPKPPRNAPDEIVNYDQRVPVENGSFLAWGHLTYTRPLTKRQASDYELRPAPDNPDRPRSIREQMKTAAKQAEADRGQAAPKKNAPDRGDR